MVIELLITVLRIAVAVAGGFWYALDCLSRSRARVKALEEELESWRDDKHPSQLLDGCRINHLEEQLAQKDKVIHVLAEDSVAGTEDTPEFVINWAEMKVKEGTLE